MLLQGASLFAAKVNLEVQWASETAIAAVERAGGVRHDGLLRPDRLDRRRRPAEMVRERRANPSSTLAARRSYRLLHR